MTTAGSSISSLSKATASRTGLMQAASHLLHKVVSEICQNMFGAVQAQALSDGCGSGLFKHDGRQHQGADSTWCKACNACCCLQSSLPCRNTGMSACKCMQRLIWVTPPAVDMPLQSRQQARAIAESAWEGSGWILPEPSRRNNPPLQMGGQTHAQQEESPVMQEYS